MDITSALITLLLLTSAATHSAASDLSEKKVKLKVDSISHTPNSLNSFQINACFDDKCKIVKPPRKMLDFIEDGYAKVTAEDITLDGLSEIILTQTNEGSVNSCSKVYGYNIDKDTLIFMDNLPNQLCNYSIKGSHLISSYRSAAKWHEDIYKIENNRLTLEITDSCVGCDFINRTIYLSNGKKDHILVNDSVDYTLRLAISTRVVSDKAKLYQRPSMGSATKMYLINKDVVSLTAFLEAEDESWFGIRYETPQGKVINAWLMCKDIKYCSQ